MREVIMRLTPKPLEDAEHAEIVQELVRCRDCRWHEREQPGMVYCPNTVGNWVEDDWYCKGGERREDEGNVWPRADRD